ncbi:MAG: uncharacterized protein KVP18_003960 [Porospora cf. gigantea A]|uniref:uncharacterized protein n=1 Tax=Porospora cf. gigantea A TaxID=2853593 RepID=UPI003559B6E5|nr:MAG: hypothetical protein KVP18_003960 [Porospora cf. gigantea A]
MRTTLTLALFAQALGGAVDDCKNSLAEATGKCAWACGALYDSSWACPTGNAQTISGDALADCTIGVYPSLNCAKTTPVANVAGCAESFKDASCKAACNVLHDHNWACSAGPASHISSQQLADCVVTTYSSLNCKAGSPIHCDTKDKIMLGGSLWAVTDPAVAQWVTWCDSVISMANSCSEALTSAQTHGTDCALVGGAPTPTPNTTTTRATTTTTRATTTRATTTQATTTRATTTRATTTIAYTTSHDGGSGAGVCESLRIPMDTIRLGDIGSGKDSYVCVPQFRGNNPQKAMEISAHDMGIPTNRYIECRQDPWKPDSGEWLAKSDLCPAAYAVCENNKCVPYKSSSNKPTYYEKHFGRKWSGVDTWPSVTVTTYGGSCASGGVVSEWRDWAVECLGVDGVGAVPTMMYGDWAKNGQAAWRNNDLCYEVESEHSTRPLTIIIIGRCGGYTYCKNTAENTQINPILPLPNNSDSSYELPPGDFSNSHRSDGNVCILTHDAVWHGGGPSDCTTIKSRGANPVGEKYCSDSASLHRDWCARNDHPHIDLDAHTLDLICGSAGVSAGSCHLTNVKPKKCPWAVPKNPSGELGAKTFAPMEMIGEGKCPTGKTYECDGEALAAGKACWKSKAQWWFTPNSFSNFTVSSTTCCTEGAKDGFIFLVGESSTYSEDKAKQIAKANNMM